MSVLHPTIETLTGDERPDAPARVRTLRLLESLAGNASPGAIRDLDAAAKREAFAPAPTILPLTDVLLDAWALTTLRGGQPGRPPVEPYIHGVEEWEPPRTSVAWREEVATVRSASSSELAEMLADYPLKPHELLSDRTSRVLDVLEQLASEHGTSEAVPLWIVSPLGEVTPTTLAAATTDRKGGEAALADQTLLLPPTLCSPVDGTLSAAGGPSAAADVSGEWTDDEGRTMRARLRGGEPTPSGMRLVRVVDVALSRAGDDEETPERDDEPTTERWSWFVRPHGADDDGSRSAVLPVLLDVHGRDVAREADRITSRLPLAPALKRAVVLAAKLHDVGKDRRVWQRSIGNLDRARILAKAGGTMRPRDLTAYRHELGSVIDAERLDLLEGIDAQDADLVLHLVAAHHGRARPHFPGDELFDPEARGLDVAALGVEVALRFARLQTRHGRWGLAYLESLVRAADYAASASPSSTLEMS